MILLLCKYLQSRESLFWIEFAFLDEQISGNCVPRLGTQQVYHRRCQKFTLPWCMRKKRCRCAHVHSHKGFCHSSAISYDVDSSLKSSSSYTGNLPFLTYLRFVWIYIGLPFFFFWQMTLHSRYRFFYNYVCSLEIKPTTFAPLPQCFTNWVT